METPNINLPELYTVGGLREGMREELRDLRWKLYKTPRWRAIKRYRLHERIYKLDGDMGLLDHVLLDD